MDLSCLNLINIKCGEKVKTQEIGSGNLCLWLAPLLLNTVKSLSLKIKKPRYMYFVLDIMIYSEVGEEVCVIKNEASHFNFEINQGIADRLKGNRVKS